MAFDLNVNGTRHTIDADPLTPLLWVIRDHVGLTGTKFSCGIAQCGACTVHVDGQPARSCNTTVGAVAGKKITTIEGLSPKSDHPVQKAWIELDVPQCGYCQSGQIMAAAALLATKANPTVNAVVEMGQGSLTTMPAIIADELDTDLGKIRVTQAPANPKLYANPVTGAQGYGGSRGVRDHIEMLRKAGAAAREMLMQAGANEWGVPLSEVDTDLDT